MTDRYPLIANSETNRIEELASGDNLNLDNSSIVGASTITAETFIGDLVGTAQFSDALLDGSQILSGIVSTSRLSGFYDIGVGTATNLENAENILSGIVSTSRLAGDYDINITGTAQTANFLEDAGNINDGIIDAERLAGVYNISITGTASSALSVSPGTYDIDITGISSFSVISGYSTNSGISSFSEFSETSTVSENLIINSSSATSPYYPTFVSGIGTQDLNINTKFSLVPSTGRIGVNTNSPDYTLDVRGDIAFDGRLFAFSNPVGLGTTTGTLSGTNPGFIGVNTSGLQLGDLVIDVPNLRLFPNTSITTIGIGSIGISPNHLTAGTETRVLSFTRPIRVSAGTTNQVLISGGPQTSPRWINPETIISVGVEPAADNQFYNLIFTNQTSGVADLRVDSSDIRYNPSQNLLRVSGIVSTTNLVGTAATVSVLNVSTATTTNNLTVTNQTNLSNLDVSGVSTSVDLNVTGVATVNQLTVSGVTSTQDLNVSGVSTFGTGGNNVTINQGNLSAVELFGSGVNLAGIVTQITPGIGIDLTPSNGKGSVEIQAYRPTGKTIFVNQNGNDNNTGLSENHAKRTIKGAATVAVFGDTIKVYPGVYVEDNPIVLKKTVSVEGTELRNCVVTPRYPYLDLFHVNNGCHITDMSFIGPDMTDGAAVVALQPLEGVAVDRFFDAARMIRLNLDYIANETIGYLTSTSYKSPEFTIVNSSGIATDPINCKDDIKDIWKGIIFDITRGGNSKCVDAGKLYYDDSGNLVHITGVDLNGYNVKDATIDAIDYSFNIARAIINNVTWGGRPVGDNLDVVNADYNEFTGITTITVDNHGLIKDDAVKITELEFNCPSGPGIVTYPSGAYGYIFNVLNVIDEDNFEVVVGQSTLPHNYVIGGKVQKYTSFQDNFYQVKDLGMQSDPRTGFNNAITGCANVTSALRSCVGIVTNIVGFGSTAFSTVGIKTTYPGNSGIGFTSVLNIQNAVYDEVSGKTVITAPNITAIVGEPVEIRDLAFSCGSTGGISTQFFPSGAYGYDFIIDRINDDGSFEVYVGPSTLPHIYVGGGIVIDRNVAVTTATYDNTTGITTIQAEGLSIETGDLVTIRNLEFSCPSGSGTTTIYPTGSDGFTFRVLDIVIDKPIAVTTAIYDNTTGIVTITAPGILVDYDGLVEIRDLEFTCPDSPPNLLYPTGNNGYEFRVLSSIGSTFTVNVGPSTVTHTYVSGGFVIDRSNTANDTFTIQVGPSTIPHTYVSGGIVIPPYSKGVGNITQGPYIRNCTNFIPSSIGMKVDGFDAEPGDQDDIGVTGTMSVDSYTQFNQGGIGVSITNGAYSQLVSIFTICDDIAIFTGSGGQCDITNSNSSFGRLGLYSDGVGDANSKSIYRSTGIAKTTALEKTNIVEISGVGNYRPYDGQVCYFGELLFFVDVIDVIDGGSGYTVAPRVNISSPEGSNGITAQASSTIENGRVVSVNIVNSGTQYKNPPVITIDPPSGPGTQATAVVRRMQPIYYKVDSATLPSAGVSTVSLLQNLNNTVSAGTTVYFSRVSLQITSSHSFEWVGSGNDINRAKPALGGVVVPENEVVQENGGRVVYTSTDQAGNFKIGDGVIINQATGQISGRDFTKALFTTMTPFILALAE
jgi:hypothetical protein